jgi:hypothetical protein
MANLTVPITNSSMLGAKQPICRTENNSKKLPYPEDGTPVETHGPGFLQTWFVEYKPEKLQTKEDQWSGMVYLLLRVHTETKQNFSRTFQTQISRAFQGLKNKPTSIFQLLFYSFCTK